MRIITGLLIFLLLYKKSSAQFLYSELIPIRDSTVHRFTDIDQLYFLNNKINKPLKKYIHKMLSSKTESDRAYWLDKIGELRNDVAAPVLSLDYYFQNKQPVTGSNIEKFTDIITHDNNAYDIINKYYFNNEVSKDTPTLAYRKAIQEKVGWRYGYGAFCILSKEDSLYLAKMKKADVSDIDNQVEEIIQKYLALQKDIFQYDTESILKEVLDIPGVKDAIWDRCLSKTMQLPNWDQLGVLIVNNKDTVERVYTIQYSKSVFFRLGKRIMFPVYNNTRILFYKEAGYGLRYIEKTRKQCEINMKSREQKNL